MTDPNRLVRMAYASRATFKPFDTTDGLDGNVAKILETARRENKKRKLVGALYYGNGCFFQCLEGPQHAIDTLYSQLLRDPRHTDLKILSSTSINSIGFSSWEMKFATIDREIRTFLRNHNMIKFDPYRFDPTMANKLVELLHDADEEVPDEKMQPILAEIAQRDKAQTSNKNTQTMINIIFVMFTLCIIYFFIK